MVFERFLCGIIDEYEIVDGKIIFKCHFNKNFNDKLKKITNNCEILIFSDYTNTTAYKQLTFDEKSKFKPKYWSGSNFNKVLELQPNIKKLYLGNDFNNDIIFNYKLEFISFGFNYNKNTELPENTLKVIFPYMSLFNSKIVLNDKLEHLELSSDFNNNIQLNKNLKYLKFGKYFNKNLMLNDDLTDLYFGDNFNQPIKLNDKLETLVFGKKFNQILELNDNLENLYLGMEFNQKITIKYTSKLKYLFLGEKFMNNLNILSENIYCITMTKICYDHSKVLIDGDIMDKKKIQVLSASAIDIEKIFDFRNVLNGKYDKEKYIHVIFASK